MRIYLRNESTVLADADVQARVPHFQAYLRRVQAVWGLWGGGSLLYGTPTNPKDWQVVILDDSDQAGALGYHDFTATTAPISKVFAKTDLDLGYNWTVTLTHELAEMAVDPFITRCDQTSSTRVYATEVGDPVEADADGFTIVVNNISVVCSDFALPGWFIPGSPGPYDYARHCTKPLQVRPGGYAQYMDAGGWHQVNEKGEEVPMDTDDRRFTKLRYSRFR